MFVTLAYLAAQVRHARQDTRRSTQQARTDWLHQSILLLATDARLLDANLRVQRAMGAPRLRFVDALMEQSGVGEEDAAMMFYMLQAVSLVFTQMIRDIDTSTAAERIASDNTIGALFGMEPMGRLYYQTHVKAEADDNVVRYIDNLLAKPA